MIEYVTRGIATIAYSSLARHLLPICYTPVTCRWIAAWHFIHKVIRFSSVSPPSLQRDFMWWTSKLFKVPQS